MDLLKHYSVLLLEDELPTRQHLVKMIEKAPCLKLFSEASSCAEAKAALDLAQPDVLIADINLPDGCGIGVIRYALDKYPNLEAMILTICDDEQHVVGALEAGATGYLLKEHALEDIADAIIALLRGETVLDPKIARFLLKRFKKECPEIHLPCTLTSREHEVLEMISKGYSYNETADSLHISANTIRAHIRNIYKKLTVTSRSEAVFEASKMGILSLQPK